MLQEVMHSHSISVVEEAVLEPSQQAAHTPAGTHSHLWGRCWLVLASNLLPLWVQLWATRSRRFPMV